MVRAEVAKARELDRSRTRELQSAAIGVFCDHRHNGNTATTRRLWSDLMAYDVKANWMQLDVADLSPKALAHYEQYKALYRQMKAARLAFEDQQTADSELLPDERMIFGYNFGKLSAAIVPADDKAAKPKANKPASLSAFLAAQRAAGART